MKAGKINLFLYIIYLCSPIFGLTVDLLAQVIGTHNPIFIFLKPYMTKRKYWDVKWPKQVAPNIYDLGETAIFVKFRREGVVLICNTQNWNVQESWRQHVISAKLREITDDAKTFATGNKALFVHTPAGELQC